MAHITVSADKVLEAATKRIEEIKKEREDRDNKKIVKVMTNVPIRYGFLWLNKRQRTIEEAIEYLDDVSYFGWTSAYGWQDQELLEKLIVLAKHGDPVVIDENSAMALWG